MQPAALQRGAKGRAGTLHNVIVVRQNTYPIDDTQYCACNQSDTRECRPSPKVECFIEGPGVRIELFSRAVNGLHVNDFVMASKIDKLDLSDVTVKKKPQTFLM
jgi:hypothetical protein